MITKHPLRGFQVLNTGDADVACHTVVEKYGAVSFERKSSEPFGANASFVKLNGISLSYCNYKSAVDIVFPEADFVRQHIFLGGQGRVSLQDASCDIGVDRWSAIVPSGAAVNYSYGPDSRQLVIWFEAPYLQTKMNALLGTTNTGRIEFDPSQAPASAALLALRRAIGFGVSEIDIAGHHLAPLAMTEIEDLITVRFLHAHRHSGTDPLEMEALLPSMRQVKILEDYLIANWNQPLDVETMARISNVSARSVFRYFKQAKGCSPHAFLKDIRLKQARDALRSPSNGTTVLAVALRCGFQSLGHFARDYRVAFGELPSATLNRAA